MRLEGLSDSDQARLFSVHAAVIAINEAIDRGQAAATMAALNNPNAMLKNAKEALADDYQSTLGQAKARKLNQSSGKVRNPTNCDLYLIVFDGSFCSPAQLCGASPVCLVCAPMGNGTQDFCSE